MAEISSVRITCTAPVNIAIIKYWGKRDEELILPLNSSLSISLHQDQLKSTTTVMASPAFSEDRLWLNGQEESVQGSRLQALLHEVRRRAAKRPLEEVQREEEEDEAEGVNSDHRLAPPSWHVHISSKNNFPTGAGLASSASGYACLAFTLAQLFGVRGELSGIAKRGSGSACRSMYGGVVRWTRGAQADGADSIAVQVTPENYWPELRIFILVVSDLQKAVSSSEGMRRSVATSKLLQHRATVLVPELLRKAEAAVKARDFAAFAQLAMCDSNQLHAICLDTHPPIFYLNDTSRQIMRLVHAYNQACAEIRAGYTFDAGPNAFVLTTARDASKLLGLIEHFFPAQTSTSKRYIRGLPLATNPPSVELQRIIGLEPQPHTLHYILCTKPGPGPQRIFDSEAHLLNTDGLPGN
uniref:diphosphomevalonate decarboxylase isoform X2 n=1 Tax=Myxine glutinosa TaxID=7769 RepID=UPI00358E5CBD